MKILDQQQVLEILPERKQDTHKGSYGRILLLCGSRGYTGAAALSAMGALRSGAGLVYLGIPESVYPIMAVKLTEPIVFPLPDRDGKLNTSGQKEILSLADNMDAILIGPGLGKSADTASITQCVLEHYPGPVVLDADGINVIAAHKDILRGRTGPTILTPHPGEFQRMTGTLITDRKADAEKLARQTGTIVVLKGHHSIITDGTTTYMNTTGNPGMAVGGSGDVLAGIITALLGQGIKPLEAAACGAWIHGAAGDECAKQIGQYGMLPTDMLDVLPRLLK